MARIAVDVVLLPSEKMMDIAIGLNRELLKTLGNKIVLNKENCIPHISLAMGCVDKKDIAIIRRTLETIAEQCALGDLKAVGIKTSTNSVGEKVSVLEIEKTRELQMLHETVMEKLEPYFTYDVTADMLFSPPEVESSTLLWIKNYRQNSSFGNFFPHITVGFGQINKPEYPVEFAASKLVLCHLGNHCTCRKILASTQLEI